MKYLEKSFSTPANSQAFRDNWDAVFSEPECQCYGRGWYPEMIPGSDTDYRERYCSCPRGTRLRIDETG